MAFIIDGQNSLIRGHFLFFGSIRDKFDRIS